ncbi:Myb-like dna-binding protein, partial [Globisporangium splendens]
MVVNPPALCGLISFSQPHSRDHLLSRRHPLSTILQTKEVTQCHPSPAQPRRRRDDPFCDFLDLRKAQLGRKPSRVFSLPVLIRMNDVAQYPVFSFSSSPSMANQQQQPRQRAKGIWSTEEHDRFLDALKKYPLGPWKTITDHVGSRSIRQVQTHAQKYQEKVLRRLNGSSKAKVLRLRQEHRIDHDVLESQALIGTPGERRKSARKSTRSKLNASLATAESRDRQSLEDGQEQDVDLDENQWDDDDLFRISLSEFYDEEDLAKLETQADEADDGDDDDGDDKNLPSLSECLDFFITCFSSTTTSASAQPR